MPVFASAVILLPVFYGRMVLKTCITWRAGLILSNILINKLEDLRRQDEFNVHMDIGWCSSAVLSDYQK